MKVPHANAISDPLELLSQSIDEARSSGEMWPHAMTLATIGLDGAPNARPVIVRDITERGLEFFTDGRSVKSRELERERYAAGTFLWPALRRAGRVRGQVMDLPQAIADRYAHALPNEMRVIAAAAPQSSVVARREDVLALAHLAEQQGAPAGPHPWVGYALQPTTVEIWQEGINYVHDRAVWDRSSGTWRATRLTP